MANRFGYALAFGRSPSTAIRDDLAVYLSELDGGALASADDFPNVSVTHLKPNNTGLFAAIEYRVSVDNGTEILMSLVVTIKGSEKYLGLEGLSAAR